MSRYRSEIIVCLFLIITTLAVYWQVINHDFINCDDNDYVTENLHVRAGWTEEGVAWGVEFGAHTATHPDLTKLPVQEAEQEIRQSRLVLLYVTSVQSCL